MLHRQPGTIGEMMGDWSPARDQCEQCRTEGIFPPTRSDGQRAQSAPTQIATTQGTPRAHAANRRELNQCLKLGCGHPHNLKVVGSNPIRPYSFWSAENVRFDAKRLTSNSFHGHFMGEIARPSS
jgi:hypothetical protein